MAVVNVNVVSLLHTSLLVEAEAQRLRKINAKKNRMDGTYFSASSTLCLFEDIYIYLYILYVYLYVFSINSYYNFYLFIYVFFVEQNLLFRRMPIVRYKSS